MCTNCKGDHMSPQNSVLSGKKKKFIKLKLKQVRPNDVWTCVACSYFIYKKIDIKNLDC